MYALVLLLLADNPVMAGESFWHAIQSMCGQAFAGSMTQGTEPSDAEFAREEMVMHVAECGATEIRIPFHVGENRSRTWILTRSAEGVRLKHDHRHEDGSEDRITQYGGDTRDSAHGTRLDFHADAFTGELIPAASNNIWTIDVRPGDVFVYQLRREAQQRYFRVEFDLARPVEPPPPPW